MYTLLAKSEIKRISGWSKLRYLNELRIQNNLRILLKGNDNAEIITVRRKILASSLLYTDFYETFILKIKS